MMRASRAIAFAGVFVVVACSSSSDDAGGASPASNPEAGCGESADCAGNTDDGGSTPADGSVSPAKGSGGTGGTIGASVALTGCTDCRVHVPSGYAATKPAPLLVALHGDEGPAAGVPSVINLWSAAADKHGYLVLALACSADIGTW